MALHSLHEDGHLDQFLGNWVWRQSESLQRGCFQERPDAIAGEHHQHHQILSHKPHPGLANRISYQAFVGQPEATLPRGNNPQVPEYVLWDSTVAGASVYQCFYWLIVVSIQVCHFYFNRECSHVPSLVSG